MPASAISITSRSACGGIRRPMDLHAVGLGPTGELGQELRANAPLFPCGRARAARRVPARSGSDANAAARPLERLQRIVVQRALQLVVGDGCSDSRFGIQLRSCAALPAPWLVRCVKSKRGPRRCAPPSAAAVTVSSRPAGASGTLYRTRPAWVRRWLPDSASCGEASRSQAPDAPPRTHLQTRSSPRLPAARASPPRARAPAAIAARGRRASPRCRWHVG